MSQAIRYEARRFQRFWSTFEREIREEKKVSRKKGKD